MVLSKDNKHEDVILKFFDKRNSSKVFVRDNYLLKVENT